jgi:ankyrin repeat protein
MVKFLIASGADVNIKTYSGVTPLMAAIYRENLDMVK